MRGHRWLAFPLAVVGMNSIAVYCMAELIDGWLAHMFKIHLNAYDAAAHTSLATKWFDASTAPGAVRLSCVVLFLIWLISYWLYRRRIFFRI